jgi:nitronate monooxygenase
MLLDQLKVPIVLAPLGGGPSTPQLVAAVCEADGFGFLAGGYLTPQRLAEQIAEVRSLTARPFGVNVFSRPHGPADPELYSSYIAGLQRWAGSRGLPVGDARFSDDHFAEKIELLAQAPVSVVSFAFGAPGLEVVRRLHATGSEVWTTVTSPVEAAAATDGGADALIIQGVEAGGHRGGFDDDDETPAYSLLSLVQLLADAGKPLVATGGIASGRGVAAAMTAGARAAQLGTAFLLCPEAGTADAHREALRQGRAPTRLTRAFTGRTARGIINQFMVEHDADAVAAYPEIHYVTQPFRQAARKAGDSSLINLWAGEAYPLIRELPAGALVRLLARETSDAIEDAAARGVEPR